MSCLAINVPFSPSSSKMQHHQSLQVYPLTSLWAALCLEGARALCTANAGLHPDVTEGCCLSLPELSGFLTFLSVSFLGRQG